ncbi:helix-turn-helix transcriptional regulator [Streptomyces sp. FH025]|uniref:helix-turn-helix domain-containing protein n=1 Tax=Streptomyces sp. FH025 TaxID=2815937 RepID=UPI0027DC4E08|nr:helix-turn-helix transcriptional regulator [Streptomyces sp. FH025]
MTVTPNGIGELLRKSRERTGLTREDQAAAIGEATGEWCSPDTVKNWETEKRVPRRPSLQGIADAYGLPVDQVAEAVARSRQYRREHGTEDRVNRRKFIGTGVAAAAGAVVLPGIAQARVGIESALTPSGDGDLAYLEAAFERHRGGYRGRSPDRVLAEMLADLDLLQDVLNRPHPARARADLARTAAGITGLVAIVQHDRGDQRSAFQWFATAERAARESSDQRMLAWVLARHAMVPLNYGAPEAAARIAERARFEAGDGPTAAGALAAAVTARALAASGDSDGASRAVDDVRTLAERLDGAESADTWFGYPEQKHFVHLSQAYTLLGDSSNAYSAQEEALRLTDSPSVMTRALLAMDTAACLRVEGDHAGASAMAVGVWERLPSGYREGLIRSRASLLHEKLDGRARNELGEVLADS